MNKHVHKFSTNLHNVSNISNTIIGGILPWSAFYLKQINSTIHQYPSCVTCPHLVMSLSSLQSIVFLAVLNCIPELIIRIIPEPLLVMDLVAICKCSAIRNWSLWKTENIIIRTCTEKHGYPSLGGAVCSMEFCGCGKLSSRWTWTFASSTKLYGGLESWLTSFAASVSESWAESHS